MSTIEQSAKTEQPKTPRLDTKKAVTFAAYLLIALPANVAMASGWQTPAQVAALNAPSASQQGTSITVTTAAVQRPGYFQVTYDDVADEVARQLTSQGVEKQARATTMPANSPVLYTADHPLKLVLQALQVNPEKRQWQAQAHLIAAGRTEAVKPVSGHYEGVVSVPVLSRQLRGGDIIEPADLGTRDIASRNVRKDTILDPAQLIGKSPRGTISGDRPIRQSEISAPVLIKKGELVEISYTTPHMFIRTTGVALEDGEEGGSIRIKNDKSARTVSGRVISAGKVEANLQAGS